MPSLKKTVLRLKSLEIKGFKSFADKTHIILDNPITGIVGPNGCGKSNIVDAIRWVIGEHKIKSLRSDNLEDLIFNGSRTRSASGMAEVSLTFENTRNLLPTEFTTVTITRKFFKNGDSEYRLNDVACRLKDIHNLFLDTGVSNDSYAIIELGMVDDIIKDKDGARRRMLEQAAGISIYKTRKKEAKQKLDATQQDLSRIEDILFEISNNLKTLESQAKKAEKYLLVKNEYKNVSIELAKASLEHFNEQYKDLNQQKDTETDRKTQIEAIIATEEAAIAQQKVSLIDKEQELNLLQKLFNELVNRIRQLESDKKLSTQKIEHLKEREIILKDFLSGAGVQSIKLNDSITFSNNQASEETSVLDSLRNELEQLRKDVDEKRKTYDEKKKFLEQLRSDYQQRQRIQFDAEKKVAIADTSLINLQRSLQQIHDEKNIRETQIHNIEKEKTETVQKLSLKQNELNELSTRQENVKQNILVNQEQIEKLRSQLIEENRKLDAKKNEHDLLKSLVESLEGYPDSIKFLKKNKEWDNASPLLSDVFIVNNEYRTALENVLDNYLNYYLVANIEEAAKAIVLLDRNKKGKANFFLLNQTGEYNNQDYAIPEGTIAALSVIDIDEQYSEIAKHLLGHVFISETNNTLNFPNLESGMVLVDKTGKCLKGKYTIGGGSTGVFEGNKIGRAKNLERLANEIKELTIITTNLKQQIADIQKQLTGFTLSLNDKVIDQCKKDMNTLQNHCVNLEHRIENFEQLNNNSSKRVQELQTQITDNNTKIDLSRKELEKISADLKYLQENINKAENEFKTIELGYNEGNQYYNKQNINYTRQHSKLDSIKQELRFKNNQFNDLKKQITTSTEQLQQILAQKVDTDKLLQQINKELSELLVKKETDEKVLNDTDRAFYQLRQNIEKQDGHINQKRREKEQVETILLGIKDKLNAMKLQVAGISERLNIEFKVVLNDILDEARTTNHTVKELTDDAEKLKKRLDNMGEINPTAIEAFNEIKTRHTFITEQKNDLVSARESLLTTIKEVETTANTKFNDTFNLVRENFVQVFKALFTADDNCNLSLTEPDNLAESNIEIYAQPKGKKPSTLTQLSGGEKTLTSTAFLFAIYLIKPAPFCILDEVDAPLDDANVGKFTQMIRKFSDNSQFIIVTHNKQTMASVDVIYGVTMQEAGVSKLVAVDFRSLKE